MHESAFRDQSLPRAFLVRGAGGPVGASHYHDVRIQPADSIREGRPEIPDPCREVVSLGDQHELLCDVDRRTQTGQYGNFRCRTSDLSDLLHPHPHADCRGHPRILHHVALAAGQFFGNRYAIRRFIDRGTYGEVYEAVDTHQDQRVVALKLLDPAKLGTWPWHEATLLTRLDSEYIVTIFNADIDAGIPFLATELVTLGSLETAGELPRLSVAETITLTRTAARGLARAHDGSVVHRDIKPANLFRSANGAALVGDFGLAHPLDANGEAPGTGTPATAAPEVLNGGPATVRSDVWSLGATMYKLLTGIYPHEDHNPASPLSNLGPARTARPPTGVRELAPQISQRLASRIERALAMRPSDRYPSMTNFESDLGADTTPSLSWSENRPHAGHLRCWSCGAQPKYLVCLIQGATTAKASIEVRQGASNRRVRRYCSRDIYMRDATRRLRRVFEKLGN